jgi:hypothetical protein
LFLIYTNVWYSVLYKYIEATENSDYVRIDVLRRREIQREHIREEEDPFAPTQSVAKSNEDRAGYDDEAMEMQIISGDLKELQTHVAEMILAFLGIDEQNKKSIDLSYEQLEKRIVRSKLREKKMITDYLRDMERDERRVEDMKKILKLGRWNVGLRAGLVKYDKERYDEEREELFNQLTNRADAEDEEIPIHRTVDELEQEDNDAINEEYDQEAIDIQGLDEDYRDAGYE